ncbi:MAG TPA: hypothetical protein VMW42_12930 [Desulfatiglandales bacterium]|nr:hypothetical protein [Desulfatiglandales bacterium]
MDVIEKLQGISQEKLVAKKIDGLWLAKQSQAQHYENKECTISISVVIGADRLEV